MPSQAFCKFGFEEQLPPLCWVGALCNASNHNPKFDMHMIMKHHAFMFTGLNTMQLPCRLHQKTDRPLHAHIDDSSVVIVLDNPLRDVHIWHMR
jgi:hypothetical protein